MSPPPLPAARWQLRSGFPADLLKTSPGSLLPLSRGEPAAPVVIGIPAGGGIGCSIGGFPFFHPIRVLRLAEVCPVVFSTSNRAPSAPEPQGSGLLIPRHLAEARQWISGPTPGSTS